MNNNDVFSQMMRQSVGYALVVIIVSMIAFLPMAAALAEDGQSGQENGDKDETEVIIGLGAGFAPEFEGASGVEFTPLPLITINDFYGFNLGHDGLSYNLYSYENQTSGIRFDVLPKVSIAQGRDDEDSSSIFSSGSDYLRGLGDIDTGVALGAEFTLGYKSYYTSLDISREVADGHDGTLAEFGVGAQIPLTNRLMFNPEVTATWADETYNQAFFGVSNTQAAASSFTAFDADAGIKDVGVALNMQYSVTEHWLLMSSLGYSRLIGDAADSPIVTGSDGSVDQFTGLLAIGYRF